MELEDVNGDTTMGTCVSLGVYNVTCTLVRDF